MAFGWEEQIKELVKSGKPEALNVQLKNIITGGTAKLADINSSLSQLKTNKKNIKVAKIISQVQEASLIEASLENFNTAAKHSLLGNCRLSEISQQIQNIEGNLQLIKPSYFYIYLRQNYITELLAFESTLSGENTNDSIASQKLLSILIGIIYEAAGNYAEAFTNYSKSCDLPKGIESLIAPYINNFAEYSITKITELMKKLAEDFSKETFSKDRYNKYLQYAQCDYEPLENGLLFPMSLRMRLIGKSDPASNSHYHTYESNYQNRIKMLKKMIASKKSELNLFEKAEKDQAYDIRICEGGDCIYEEPNKPYKESLGRDIGKLESIKERLENEESDLEKQLFIQRSNFRNYMAECLFFDCRRFNPGAKGEVLALTKEIIDIRFGIHKKTITLNISARILISAEKLFQEVFLILLSSIDGLRNKNMFPILPKDKKHFHPENYDINKFEKLVRFSHSTNLSRQRIGSGYLNFEGGRSNKYIDIYKFLDQITGKKKDIGQDKKNENVKQIVDWMIRYGQTGQGTERDELENVYTGASELDTFHFNLICFLIITKEQPQWLSANDSNSQFGMSVTQARCLLMLAKGQISLEDAFKTKYTGVGHSGNDEYDPATFGVYSGTRLTTPGNGYKITEPTNVINRAYSASFFKNSPPPNVILTREQAHQDLRAVYDDGNCTAGEEYGSDLDESGEAEQTFAY